MTISNSFLYFNSDDLRHTDGPCPLNPADKHVRECSQSSNLHIYYIRYNNIIKSRFSAFSFFFVPVYYSFWTCSEIKKILITKKIHKQPIESNVKCFPCLRTLKIMMFASVECYLCGGLKNKTFCL